MHIATGQKKRVAVWGTFDLLHEGHLVFLETAAQIGDLYVIVIPDDQVLSNKGYLPDNDTATRKHNLEKLPCTKKVYIDCLDMGLASIDDIRPDYFCLGYDQDVSWENTLRTALAARGLHPLFQRLEQYANGIHSRHLRQGRKRA